MLRFILHAHHQLTLRPFATRWAGAIGKRIVIVSYDELFRSARAPRCVHVFTDLEHLNDEESENAAHVWNDIREQEPRIRLLNHPLRGMRRYELLRTMYEAGINRFDAFRLTEARLPKRFPLFIRSENDHAGPETALIQSREEYDAAVESLCVDAKSRGSRIAVEFCAEPFDDGLYRKYAAFFVDGEVIPRQVMVSPDWMVKARTRRVSDAQLEEERRYLDTNPHADWIRRVFTLARLDYGRIDYGIVGGEPQLYEINSNPTVVPAETASIKPTTRWFCEAFSNRLARLEKESEFGGERRYFALGRPLKSGRGRILSRLLQSTIGRQLRRSV